MATSYDSVNVKCPFYQTNCANKLTCEGIVDGSSITWRFHDTKERKRQMTVFCCNRYKNCELYRMLMEAKFEDDEEIGP